MSALSDIAKTLLEQEARDRRDWLDAMRRCYEDDHELVPPKKAERIAAIAPLTRDELFRLCPAESPLQAGRAAVDHLIDRGVFYAHNRTVLHRPKGEGIAFVLPNVDAFAEALHRESDLDCNRDDASRLYEYVITLGNERYSENVRAMQAQARDSEA